MNSSNDGIRNSRSRYRTIGKEGFYFITICTHRRQNCFWLMSNDWDGLTNTNYSNSCLNEAGKMIEKWYWKLEEKFPGIRCHEMVVMPDHFHCLLEINYNLSYVRAENRQRQIDLSTENTTGFKEEWIGVFERFEKFLVSPCEAENQDEGHTEHFEIDGLKPALNRVKSEPENSPIAAVIQWFKTMTTNEYIRGVKDLGWKRFKDKVWQRGYYRVDVKGEIALLRITEYIKQNPNKERYRGVHGLKNSD